MCKDTFKKYSDQVYEELLNAHAHYSLYVDIRQAVPDYQNAMNQSKRFWSVTLNAHLETTRIILCRLYDQEAKALGLKKWLEYFRKNIVDEQYYNPSIRETHNTKPLTDSEIEDDIKLVSNSNTLVKVLTILRGNHFAHTNASNVAMSRSLFEKYPLVLSDYEKLLDRGEKIFNRYNILFSKSYSAIKTLEQEKDHEFVFSAIKEKSDRVND